MGDADRLHVVRPDRRGHDLRRRATLTPAVAAKPHERRRGLSRSIAPIVETRDRRIASFRAPRSKRAGPSGPILTFAAGTLSYDAGSPAVTAETIYDLASLTKVIATTALMSGEVATRPDAARRPRASLDRRVDGRRTSARDPSRSARARLGPAGASQVFRIAAGPRRRSNWRFARSRSTTRRARNRSTAIPDSCCLASRSKTPPATPLDRQFDRWRDRELGAGLARSLSARHQTGCRGSRRPKTRRMVTSGAARCTTKTRRRSAASRRTPGCSEPRPPSARARDGG